MRLEDTILAAGGAATAMNPMLGLAANVVRQGAPKVGIKDLAVGAASAANPMLGLAANTVRHRAPTDGNFLPNLGKSLTHHQVIPAVIQSRVANNPRTDFGKAILSSTGGNPRAVNQAIDGIRARAVGQISHLDRRLQMAKGLDTALKLKPSVKSLISN